MKIKALNRTYIQKSRLFLYPLLGIKRGVSVTPIQTYLGWEDAYCFSDSKLVCVYYRREDSDFKVFEEVKLLGNPLFHAYHVIDEDKCAYVFDLSKFGEDFWKVTTGQYSKMSPEGKKLVLNFFKSHTAHFVYIQSYLEPKKYYSMYSEILGCKIESLKKAVELCDKPDLDLEALKVEIDAVKDEIIQ